MNYFHFLLKSTNHHGVHSPFIYNFVTKCLYKKLKNKDFNFILKEKNFKLNQKKLTFLFKLIKYFNIENFIVLNEDKNLDFSFLNNFFNLSAEKNIIFTEKSELFSTFQEKKNKIDLKIINSDDFYTENITENTHNDSIFCVFSPHKNKKREKNWRNLLNDEEISVSVDIFDFGLAFRRKQQLKEKFYIRY